MPEPWPDLALGLQQGPTLHRNNEAGFGGGIQPEGGGERAERERTLPLRPGTCLLISLQELTPRRATQWVSSASSSSLQAPFLWSSLIVGAARQPVLRGVGGGGVQ